MTRDLAELISNNILNFNEDEILHVYRQLKLESKTEVTNVSFLKNGFFDFGQGADYNSFQIDLPFWNSYTEGKESVMVVGMDPKRSSISKDLPKDIILNTPYSLHCKDGRDTKQNQYWSILSRLINDYNVYTTDLYKLYFNQINSQNNAKLPSNKIFEYVSMSIHKSILEEEIRYVSPSAIICFGNASRNACAGLLGLKIDKQITKDNMMRGYSLKLNDKMIKFIAIPHPSGLTRPNNWKDFYLANELPEIISHHARPDFLANLIRQSLKS
jgi:hypothetical protein